MFIRSVKLFMLMALCVTLLSACGGSGDSGSFCGYDEFGDPLFCQYNPPPSAPTPVASTSSFPVAQALTNIATQQYSFNVSAYDSYGNVYTITYASTPQASASFGTQNASTAAIVETLYENGTLLQTLNVADYFIASPYQFLGSSENVAGGYEVVNTWQTPPIAATVGQVFPSLTATLYHDSTMTASDGSLSETIGLSADTATTALLCFADATQLTQAGINDGLSNGDSSTCFRIDTSGNVLGVQINATIGGMPMQFY